MPVVPLREIESARARISGRVHRTPIAGSATLGRVAGVRLTLKLESFQKTGSFKPRGAVNRLATLDREALERGVVTASAGNHAQALAYAASLERARCVVVMPSSAPKSKIRAARGYGAEILPHEDVRTIFERTEEVREEFGLEFVHAFDDPAIVAGAATCGLEILEDVPDAAAIVVPVGGGGLIAGVASAVHAVRPDCRVIGVEPEGAACLTRALEAGRSVRLERIETIADGLAPPWVGELNLAIAREAVDDVVLVSDEEIVEAMRQLATYCKVVSEPAGAAAVAAILFRRIPGPLSPVVAIVSGGNVDLSTLKDLL